ncbi:Polysulfide reductase, NrfD [Halalkaliarchaeum sp. AArc-CO]|uniref:NrfD/PsrC family molybdoenzyme membrane anchor subunit n=1 Tax=Halalkaliarchaeum sp. AArc-CO TaxID=2866381 RepID=UPI00217ED730|nr:NrfD/PsrC family molybdoenzyme membrane anchor subunit [Halalkaliarchaeum sp. AArc-CO]UWG50822.1 Polysulfide reductase, NrfD [Halalkaliarchaeum sp. AArc-CO]
MAARTEYSWDHLSGVSTRLLGLIVFLTAIALLTLEAIVHQVQHGLVVTDLAAQGTQAGTTWGLYIGTFEWFAGMAVATLAITGYIRFYELDEYDMIARIANIWAFICGLTAAWLIIIDLGTPHRVLTILAQWPSTVVHSPLAWDVTFVTTLLVFTLTMLTISLRLDFLRTEGSLPLHADVVRRVVSFGATEAEIPKLESMRKWLGLGLMVLAFTAGMIPGILLGVVGQQPGFFGREQGIIFVINGLVAGTALVTLSAGILRLQFAWHDKLSDRVMRGLGQALTTFGFVFLVVMFNEVLQGLTGMQQFFEQRISDAILFGSLSPFFYSSIVLVGVPTLLLAIFKYQLGVKYINVLSFSMMLGVWIKSILKVIEPLVFPVVPGFIGSYNPTIVEWIITIGAIAIALLLFVVIAKVIPLARDSSREVDR